MSKSLRILLSVVLLLIILLLSCEEGSGTCHALWASCPGSEYMICRQASDLEQSVSGDTRFFSYYNCNLSMRTPTLSVSKECHVSFRY